MIGYVIVFAATALSVKGIQALLGTEKARAQERRREDSPTGSPDDLELEYIPQTTPTSSTTPLLAPAPAAEPARIRGAGPVCTSLSNIRQIESPIRQYPTSISSLSPSTFHRILAHLLLHLDTTIYALIFLLIGLPTYYAIGYTMPLHLSLTILAYRLSTKLPSSILRFLHPVLGCSALTLLGILILSHSLSRTESLTSALQSYSTGTRYLTLFTTTTPSSLPLPGAGDIFASLLDISIISLSMPMYTHRRALRLNILSILPPCLILSIASLTLYPLVCNLLSISPTRSKTFAARSLTLALATPAVANLGGDTQFIALLSIVSGIVGALVAERGFRLLRVKEEDFVTRGVVIGANSAAIGTAWLVGRGDVRAAAVSSVSMVLLGTVVVVLTSLPALRGVVEGLVGEA